MLPRLIKDAEQGQAIELARGDEHTALLLSAARAAELGIDLDGAPAYGVAEARPILGDLVARAADGTPQVLRRHRTVVAVLAPADILGASTADTASAPPPEGPTAAGDGASAQRDGESADAAPGLPSGGLTAVGTGVSVRRDGGPADAASGTPSAELSDGPSGGSTAAGDGASARRGGESADAGSGLPSGGPADGSTAGGEDVSVERAGGAAGVVAGRALAALGDVLDSVLPGAQAGPVSASRTGLPTGIRVLDEALGGLQPGRCYLVAGAPGTGASLVVTAAARTAALGHHRPVLYAASGLTRQDVAARIVAAHTPVDYRRLRARTLTEAERQAVAATAELLAAAPLLIDDGSGLDTEALTTTAADVPDLALLVVDRLQWVRDPRLPLSGPAAIRDAVQALAHLARTRDLPVLVALDTDDAALLRTLAPDLTLTLEPHRAGTGGGDQVRLTVTERDLGVLATVVLHADLAHARLTDPVAPAVPAVPAEAPGASGVPERPPAARVPDAQDPAATTQQSIPAPAGPTGDADAPPTPAAAPSQPVRSAGGGGGEYAGRELGHFLDMIGAAVAQALEECGGDAEAATTVLENRAIPNGMALFEATRVGATYEHTVYPERLEFLSKKTRSGADDVWEGRHKWENAPLVDALRKGTTPPVVVDVLDTNAAYCSALKTHLPIGALQHRPDGGFDAKRSGVYLLPERPVWEHPHLPDPIGGRREKGPVLLDDATVRLLIRCHRLGLAEAPRIGEAWTSGASESLLEKFRRVLVLAREQAVTDGDTVTERYVKAIYAKFVSTIGESTYNRDLRRPDWMHIIRSQAFANLWYKAHRAHTAGLTVVRLRGTDELHTTGGDWRTVFDEGRLATQMKLKDQYTLPQTRKGA